jgi:dTDP-4-dehydrorhamnose reductase
MKKVLITGCNGLLGQKLVLEFIQDFEVHGLDIHAHCFLEKFNIRYGTVDITNRPEITRFITKLAPDVIVNAAAYTDVDGAETEKELCWKINVTGVENLVVAARKTGAHLIHLSTDYIFDGENGPYQEDDPPQPTGYYGKSKLAGENVIKNSPVKWSIIRTMVLYGAGENLRPNFVTWLIRELRAGKSVRIVDDQLGNPTLADDLADGIHEVARQEKTGIYHMSGSEILSRYDFSLMIAEEFGLDPKLIIRIKTSDLSQKAPRPLKSGWILDRAHNELGLTFMTARESLLHLKHQLQI